MASLTHNRRGLAAIVAASALIAFFTLSPQGGRAHRPFDFCIICGDFGAANVILNAFLFLPLGAALRRKSVPLALTLIICGATTVAVEMAQLLVVTGRYAALGDILSNVAGGLLGWVLAANWRLFVHPTLQQGLVLSGAQAASMAGVVVAVGWLFHSSPTSQAYFGQIAPVLADRGAVDGIVSESLVDDNALPEGELPQSLAESIRGLMHRNQLSLRGNLVLRSAKRRPVMILRIADMDGEEIARLGHAGHDAFFAVRTRAAGVTLLQPMLILPGAFRCDSCPGGFDQNRITITGERRGATYNLIVEGNGSERRSTMDISGNMFWLALSPSTVGTGTFVRQVSIVWLIAQSVFLGYWLSHTAKGSRSTALVVGIATALGVVTQVVIPSMQGTAIGSTLELSAIALGSLAGSSIARRTRAALADAGHSGRRG